MIKLKDDRANKKISIHLEKSEFLFKDGIKNALHEIGSENVKQLRKFITSGPRSGNLYFYRGRLHRASAPGESPAKMSGRLTRTLDYKVRGNYQSEFGDTAFYGDFLESGTKNMAPRPHVIRTVNKKRRDNYNSLKSNVYDRVIKL